MRNNDPVPLTCALCGKTGHGFNVERCWVYAGMAQRLYALCEECLDTRHPQTSVGANGQAVFTGTPTRDDIQAQLDDLRRDLNQLKEAR